MSVPGWGKSARERTSTTTTLLHHNNYNKSTNLVSRVLSHPRLRSKRGVEERTWECGCNSTRSQAPHSLKNWIQVTLKRGEHCTKLDSEVVQGFSLKLPQ